MRTLIGIAGTTAVGKSAVAVELAKLLHTEVISADSMQIYKGMDVGTAKITLNEMQGVVHHMLDVVEPNCQYSSFLYQQQASEIIDNMKTVPIVVGGTGFYFDSLIYPPEYGNAEKGRRDELLEIYRTEGLAALRELLAQLDENALHTIDVNNYKRVIRAIEIAESGASRATGTRLNSPRYNLVLFVLQRDRQKLYEAIDKRVEQMFANGLVDEVKTLIDRYCFCDTPAFQAIGYKEIAEYLQNKCTLQQAEQNIKLNTRHYAKRQITYFKRMNVTEFIDVDRFVGDELANYLYKKISEKGVI